MQELQVFFCDVCNTSVPEKDIDEGTATRVHGKVIGACCVAKIRGTASAPAAPSAAPEVSAASPAASAPGATPSARPMTGGTLTVGAVLLAGLAAATMFLDWRIGQESRSALAAVDEVRRTAGQQGDAIGLLDARLEGVATAASVGEVAASIERLEGQDASLAGESSARFRELDGRLADVVRRLDDLAVAGSEDRRQLALLRDAVSGLERRGVSTPVREADVGTREPVEPAPVAKDDSMEPAPPEKDSKPFENAIGRLASDDPGTRFNAVRDLIETGDAAVVPHLAASAKDADLWVRHLLFSGLGDLPRTAQSVDLLLTGLSDEIDLARQAAVDSLRRLTSESHGFDAHGSRRDRDAARKRWEKWWKENRDAF